MHQPLVGFVGQGYIGKNYADDIETRGFSTVRYSLEEQYIGNKDRIKDCDVVFVAVPTPTTPTGFNDRIVRDAVTLVGEGKVVVIKSTMLPGTTESIQKENPDKIILYSPEFLVGSTAAYDAAHPTRTIIGLPVDDSAHRDAVALVLSVLPKAPFEKICSSRDAEMIKYAGNCFLLTKVVFANVFHDIAISLGADWDVVAEALGADPRIGPSHLGVVDASRHPGAKAGRGAGGLCFPKDLAALRGKYEQTTQDDATGLEVLKALERKNIELLIQSGKDLNILKDIYGDHPEVV